MSFGLSAIASVCLFILPGFIYLFAEARQKQIPPSFSINRELLIAILISIAFHFIFIVAIELCPFLPNVDFRETYRALSGTGGYIPGAQFERSIPYLAIYLLALYSACLLVGRLATKGIPGLRPLEMLATPTGPEKYLTTGEIGVWCIVDIITMSNKLYRGVYHSMSPKGDHCPSGSINLVLASRWSGKVKSVADNDDTAEVPAPGFRDIRAWVSIDELREMIRMASGADQDEQVRRDIEFFVKYEGAMEQILVTLRDGIPEFYVFWNDIKNINVRHFQLNSDNQPTTEEIELQFPEVNEDDIDLAT